MADHACLVFEREFSDFGEPSPPLFIGWARGRGKGEKTKRGLDLSTKCHIRRAWSYPPNGGRKPHGGPPQAMAEMVLPPKGGPTTLPTTFFSHQNGEFLLEGNPIKNQPMNSGILSPIGEHRVFRASSLRKNSGRSQNISGTLQKVPGACQNLFGLMVYSETTFRFHRNFSGFSLWNFFVVSETFPVSFSQTPCLVLSR